MGASNPSYTYYLGYYYLILGKKNINPIPAISSQPSSKVETFCHDLRQFAVPLVIRREPQYLLQVLPNKTGRRYSRERVLWKVRSSPRRGQWVGCVGAPDVMLADRWIRWTSRPTPTTSCSPPPAEAACGFQFQAHTRHRSSEQSVGKRYLACPS